MSVSHSAAAAKDNLLGICAALGEDFGFNPLYLRIALAAGMLWSAPVMLGLYLGAGVVVGLSHLLVRPRSKASLPVLVPVEVAPEVHEERLLEAA